MRRSSKPIGRCYSCLLNQGSHCWLYRYPRGQWRREGGCPGFENDDLYKQFTQWQKQPNVKSRKELRRAFFRSRHRKHVHREPRTG